MMDWLASKWSAAGKCTEPRRTWLRKHKVRLAALLGVPVIIAGAWPYQCMTAAVRVSLIGTLVVAWATIVLCAVTAEYASHTREMLKEMRAAREPHVVASFHSRDGLCVLTVTNVTDWPACNIRIEVLEDTDWFESDGHPSDFSVRNTYIATRGLSYLVDQASTSVDFRHPFGDRTTIDTTGKTLELRVTWQNLRGDGFSDVIEYDFYDWLYATPSR